MNNAELYELGWAVLLVLFIGCLLVWSGKVPPVPPEADEMRSVSAERGEGGGQ